MTIFFCFRSPAQTEESWNTDRTRSSSGDRPRYDGPAGMEPDGLIDSNWDEVCENFDDMSLRSVWRIKLKSLPVLFSFLSVDSVRLYVLNVIKNCLRLTGRSYSEAFMPTVSKNRLPFSSAPSCPASRDTTSLPRRNPAPERRLLFPLQSFSRWIQVLRVSLRGVPQRHEGSMSNRAS